VLKNVVAKLSTKLAQKYPKFSLTTNPPKNPHTPLKSSLKISHPPKHKISCQQYAKTSPIWRKKRPAGNTIL